MPLKKILFKPGVNQENTRYTNENGWWATDKVRFRQGTPEKIGGWTRVSGNFFLGICRSLWNWITLAGANFIGVGTNSKFYIENGGTYYDVTPIRASSTINNNPFTGDGTITVTVTDTAHGASQGDYVTFSGATGTYATLFNAEYSITTVIDANSYTITTASVVAAGSSGGASVVAAYQISIGGEYAVPIVGWGAGSWGSGSWGEGTTSLVPLRIWSQTNFGEDLIFGPRGGGIYYWENSGGVTTRAVLLSSLGGAVTFTSASPTVMTSTIAYTDGTPVQFSATGSLPTGIGAATTYYLYNVSGLTYNLQNSAGTLVNTSSTGSGVSISLLVDTPTVQNYTTVSDASRFVFAFGCNDYGSVIQNRMLLRWSDQEDAYNWTPSATNQAGSLLLSHGSQIITALQTRQEILVYTDSTLYSLQYLGPPVVWGSQLLGDNISIAGQNTAALASGVVYWMGIDKFYKYDGRVQTLRCDLRQYIYGDINLDQSEQFFASTNEGFNEVWFFYCSMTGLDGTGTTANPNVTIDRYVVYNYFENNGEGVWYYGNMGRTAWLDSGLRNYPLAATYIKNLVNHELGADDNATATPVAISSYISSAEFDIEDGNKFGFVWRILPDITFRGSTVANPSGTLTLIPMQNSGSGYNNPTSVAGSDNASITRTSTVPIEQFTGQIYVRVRGRQMILQFENEQLGAAWQLGSPRIDIKLDGGRGNS
jgi:hypothetical protein